MTYLERWVYLNAIFCLRANLSGADLTDAILTGADLSRADLSRANLRSADLRGADLNSAITDYTMVPDVLWGNTTCPNGVVQSTECPT